jgi:putative ABC transport system permease protein
MADVLSQTLATRRLIMSLLAVFAMLALVLASLGVYAVTTATVAERRGELAIRVALGAGPARMARLVVGQALLTTIGGAIVGLAVAAVGGRVVAGLLFDVQPYDPLSLGGAVAVLVAVAVGASIVPGRVAARVDPMEALKAE